jgi:hypothetical protein
MPTGEGYTEYLQSGKATVLGKMQHYTLLSVLHSLSEVTPGSLLTLGSMIFRLILMTLTAPGPPYLNFSPCPPIPCTEK